MHPVEIERRPFGLRKILGVGDLIWLVGVAWLVERSILEATPGAGVVSLLCFLALASITALIPRRFRPWAAWFAGSVTIGLFVADRVYLRFFGDLPSIGTLDALGQTDEVGRSILSLLDRGDIAAVSAILVGAGIAAASGRSGGGGLRFRMRAAAAAILCLIAAGGLWWAAERPIRRQVFRRVFVAREIGVTATHVFDLWTTASDAVRRKTVSRAEISRLERWFRDRSADRRGTGPDFGAARGMNLVMVQMESVQAFVVDLDIGGAAVMPNLRRWAEEGLYFTEVTDQTGHGRSSDAELITQTSLLPMSGRAAAFRAAGNHFTGLAGVLRDHGYHTVSAVPFDRSFWNRGVTHRAYGFETNWFAPDFQPGRVIGWGLGDRDFLAQMADRMAGLPRPFAVWMITLSLHHPFEGFPDDLEVLDVGHWEGTPVGEYLHTMHYLDQALGDLENRLGDTGLLDHSVIVVWGDHDAGFEWTPEIAQLMGVTPDSAGWYRSQRVPLVIRTPGDLERVGRIDVPAGHIDVAPTVAALLGIDPAPIAWMGRNLLGEPGDRPVVGEYDCWTTRETVFLQGEDGTLESGSCLDRETLAPRPLEDCRAAFGAAHERVGVAQKVLRFDLQQRLTERLNR